MSVDQANQSNLIWKISGALSAMIIVAAAFLYLQSKNEPTAVEQTPPAIQKKPAEQVVAPVQVEEAASQPTVEDTKALVNESILKDEVPTNPSLAKEEISKLEDIQDQLLTQQTMLIEQEKNAEELIKLKEEQIQILEEQLIASN